MSQLPSVGRIVHYHPVTEPHQENYPPRASIITVVHDNGTVDLTTFIPEGTFVNKGIKQAPEDNPKVGHWNWPPRT